MALDRDALPTLVGSTLRGSDGELGRITELYTDDESGEPTFATVDAGLGSREVFVPLAGATSSSGAVTVPYDRAKVNGAPKIAEDGHITREEEQRLYEYYGLGGGQAGTQTTQAGVAGTTGGRRDADGNGVYDDVQDRVVGHDTSGPTTDDAMTRSEERLRVGTEQRETGRARMRKFITTETQTETVPVTREEVRVEREPITDANASQAHDGPALSEEEHEVTLTEERVVVDKETVPVERVRLDKATVTEQQQVSEEVRKEQIEVEGDGTSGRNV